MLSEEERGLLSRTAVGNRACACFGDQNPSSVANTNEPLVSVKKRA